MLLKTTRHKTDHLGIKDYKLQYLSQYTTGTGTDNPCNGSEEKAQKYDFQQDACGQEKMDFQRG